MTAIEIPGYEKCDAGEWDIVVRGVHDGVEGPFYYRRQPSPEKTNWKEYKEHREKAENDFYCKSPERVDVEIRCPCGGSPNCHRCEGHGVATANKEELEKMSSKVEGGKWYDDPNWENARAAYWRTGNSNHHDTKELFDAYHAKVAEVESLKRQLKMWEDCEREEEENQTADAEWEEITVSEMNSFSTYDYRVQRRPKSAPMPEKSNEELAREITASATFLHRGDREVHDLPFSLIEFAEYLLNAVDQKTAALKEQIR